MIIPSLRGGGLERVARDLCIALAKKKHETGAFCLDGLGVHASALVDAGVHVRDCSETRFRVRGVPLKLIWALRRFGPDMIHAHSGTWFPSTISKLVLPATKLIYTEHGRYPPEPLSRAVIDRICYHITASTTAVSPTVSQYMQSYLRLTNPPMVIPNGIDLDEYLSIDNHHRTLLRESWRVGEEACLFISVGRFVEAKNHTMLLTAVQRALKIAPIIRLLLVGKGPLEEELREQAEALGIASKVIFAGFRDDVASCLGAADCFVLSSKTEGHPIALLEAMASGLPTISTDVGGIADALGLPPAGILVGPGDIGELAKAMVRFACDSGARMQLATYARQRAERFSLSKMTDAYTELYEKVTTRGN